MTETDFTADFDLNIFMMCASLNRHALRSLPSHLHVRLCRSDELAIWKAFPFDSEDDKKSYAKFMDDFFAQTYAPQSNLFFQRCLFICDQDDKPIATGFIWPAYGDITTVHWLKVLKDYEGRGIGRALLSLLMQSVEPAEFPVYLHTQLGSYRAIKLYADMGFKLLTNPVFGRRTNHIEQCLPALQQLMPTSAYQQLAFTEALESFIERLADVETDEF